MIHRALVVELRAALAEVGVRQRDLALAVGISEKHLSQLLTGKAEGSFAMWEALFAELGYRLIVEAEPLTSSE